MPTKKTELNWRVWLLVILLAVALTATACDGDDVDNADLVVEDEPGLVAEEDEGIVDEADAFEEDLAAGVPEVALDPTFVGAPVFGADETLLGTAQQYLYDEEGVIQYVIVATEDADYFAVPAAAFDVDFAGTITGEGLFYEGTASDLAGEFSYSPELLNDDLNFVVTDEIGLTGDPATLYEIGAN